MTKGLKALLRFKKNKLASISLIIISFYVLIAFLAAMGLIAEDHGLTDVALSYSPPSSNHWFGTDFLGRDVFSRVIQGTKIALTVGFFSATLACFIGLSLGSLAGYFGGRVDDIVVWLYSTLESIPSILLISAFAFSIGQGVSNLFIALGLTSWVKLCRLTRGEYLKHKNMEYVAAAHALGASHFKRIVSHILPNVMHLAFVQYTLNFIFAIKYEVILSYLGLGVEPGTPSWGIMINDASVELTRGVWWNLTAATTFMFVLILAVNLLSDGLREALDPKTRSDLAL